MNRVLPEQPIRRILKPEQRLLEGLQKEIETPLFQQAQKRADRLFLTQVFLIVLVFYALGVLYALRP